jgi:hypothetical protein
MSLTALVFAAWNVGASRAAGANGEYNSIWVVLHLPANVLTELVVDGATIFLIFNGIVISLSIAMYASRPPRSMICLFTHNPLLFPLGHWRAIKRRESRSNVLGQGFSRCCK